MARKTRKSRSQAAKKGARTRKARGAMRRVKSGVKRLASSRPARRTGRKTRPGTIGAVMKRMEKKGHSTLSGVEKRLAKRNTVAAKAKRAGRRAADLAIGAAETVIDTIR